MVLLQPKLSVKLSQRQILTPGLVQMVSVLALNKLELRDMINAEMVENPVLEELEDSVPLIDDVGRKEEERDRPATADENPIAAVEKKDDIGRLTSDIFFDLSCRGIAHVARIQDGECAMTGYVPVDPAMHGHHSNIHLLLGARRKQRVDDSVRRHFARSEEEEARRPLLKE